MWVEPPGFINFALDPRWLAEQVETVLEEGAAFGNVSLGKGESVQVEFVSINPTGPIHVGHARGGVLGDVLARVLDAAGFSVTREYYFNDAGNQMDNFYGSLYARYQQTLGRDAELPQGGYVGEYMVDVAKEIADEDGDRLLDLPAEQANRGAWPYRPGQDDAGHSERHGAPPHRLRRLVQGAHPLQRRPVREGDGHASSQQPPCRP